MKPLVRALAAGCAAHLCWACVLGREGSFETSDPQGAGGATATASASSASSSATAASTVGTGGSAPGCGDGSIDGGEACDDGNVVAGDGCDPRCAVELGWSCRGTPSTCIPIEPTVVTSAVVVPITDNGYDGNIASMTCHTLAVSSPYTSIQEVRVTLGITHYWIGDLVIKVRSPASQLTTLMSRPGMNEPADDGSDCAAPPCTTGSDYGDASNLTDGSPVTFFDTAPESAETMGAGLDDTAFVCAANGLCQYAPSPGMGPGTNLADFNGTDPNGDWAVCVADASPGYTGDFELTTLSILAY